MLKYSVRNLVKLIKVIKKIKRYYNNNIEFVLYSYLYSDYIEFCIYIRKTKWNTIVYIIVI